MASWWFQTHLKNISQIGNLPAVGVKPPRWPFAALPPATPHKPKASAVVLPCGKQSNAKALAKKNTEILMVLVGIPGIPCGDSWEKIDVHLYIFFTSTDGLHSISVFFW